MKSRIETRHVIVAELSVEEAYFLKKFLENYVIGYENQRNEDLNDKRLRISIFEGLPTFEKLESDLDQ
jgi:hypothetical protein